MRNDVSLSFTVIMYAMAGDVTVCSCAYAPCSGD